MLNNNVVRALWNGMRHAPGHEHEPGWNGKRLLQSGVLLLPCRPVSSAARRGRAVASSSQSPAALSRSHASGPDRHVSARSVERRILCFSSASICAPQACLAKDWPRFKVQRPLSNTPVQPVQHVLHPHGELHHVSHSDPMHAERAVLLWHDLCPS